MSSIDRCCSMVSSSQASTIAVNSGPNSLPGARSAPDSAPPVSESAVFPDVSCWGSSPAWPTLFTLFPAETSARKLVGWPGVESLPRRFATLDCVTLLQHFTHAITTTFISCVIVSGLPGLVRWPWRLVCGRFGCWLVFGTLWPSF